MVQQLGNPELLAQLAHLSDKVKSSNNATELHFIACNATKTVINYHQAFFWYKAFHKPKIVATAGTANLDANSPMLTFLQKLIAEQIKLQEKPELVLLDRANFSAALAEEWPEWLPEHVLWCPLISSVPNKQLLGGLIFTREYPWTNNDVSILKLVCSFISLRLGMFLKKGETKPSIFSQIKKSYLLLGIAVALLILLLLPVKQTVLAPAEIVAKQPYIITAPINEVIDKFYVNPNEHVTNGTKLFSLDQTELQNNLLISIQEYQVASERLRRASQFSFDNPESNAKLSELRIEEEKARLLVEYNRQLLDLSVVNAPVAGIVIFSDQNDWIGKPVKIGEKILEIADPDDKQLKMLLPVADAISLTPGTKIKLYLNISPLDVVDATLSYASYSATIQPDGSYAYTLKGEFTDTNTMPRIGLRGTAKIYGKSSSLFFFLLRKPLAHLRQLLGI